MTWTPERAEQAHLVSTNPTVTVKVTCTNPVDIRELERFVCAAKASLKNPWVTFSKDRENPGNPSDPGGAVRLTAYGKPLAVRRYDAPTFRPKGPQS